MKTRNYVISAAMLPMVIACGTYRHYQPSPNITVFSAEKEFQVTGEIGTSGATAKMAFAAPKNIGISLMYHGGTGIDGYKPREGEVGVGYYMASTGGLDFFALGGLGLGQSYGEASSGGRLFEGAYFKPFVQFNAGAAGGHLFKALRTDVLYCLKASYFTFDGHRNTSPRTVVKSSYMLIEPGLKLSLGGKRLRFDYTTSLPLVPTLEGMNESTNARTYPVTISVGLRLLIGVDD